MVIGEAFIYDEQKFPPQVGLDIAVPWRVVPGDLSFPAFVLSSGLLFLQNELKFEVVATFVKRLLVWGDRQNVSHILAFEQGQLHRS